MENIRERDLYKYCKSDVDSREVILLNLRKEMQSYHQEDFEITVYGGINEEVRNVKEYRNF